MEADYDALIARINSIYELMRCRETKSGRHQWRVSPLDGSADGWCKRCGVMAQTIVETAQVAEGLCPIGPPPAPVPSTEEESRREAREECIVTAHDVLGDTIANDVECATVQIAVTAAIRALNEGGKRG
jgi:hypothetical protein